MPIVAVAFAGLSQAATPEAGITWYRIVAEDGTVIGHASQEIVPLADGREIIAKREIDVRDEAPPAALLSPNSVDTTQTMSWSTVQREDSTGRAVSIVATSQIGPDWRNNRSRIEARVDGNKVEITRQTPAETRSLTVAITPAVRFDGGDDLFHSWNPATMPRIEFEDFNIDAMAPEHVVVEMLPGTRPNPDGTRDVLRKRYDGRELLSVARLKLDRDGRIVESIQPMFGSGISVQETDRETALGPHSSWRALPHLMTKSPYLISQSAMRGHIRYSFAFRDGIAFELPETSEQRATAKTGGVTVDICSDCGPGLPTDSAALADARKPTAWLQSDDPKIRAIAEPVAKLAVSDSRKMEILLQKAKPFLGKVEFIGHYSALETMSRHAADCTDAAVLLAALGRAAGIPTRVANGLVYSRESYHGVANVFMPHSWTLAYVDGKWRSFDLALDLFDSTHIALTVGDGDERSVLAAGQLASLLEWEGLVEVRSR
jgi:hypothetical protein